MDFDAHIRKIIHVDMDAFYASVEQLDNPELRGKPLAVGGSRDRGVVSAASYEARQYGVRSAMSSALAARACPGLIFVKPRFERYTEVSKQVRAIFYEFTDLVEPLALDEAFLDVTENKLSFPSATLIASEIRRRIMLQIGITASAGISINKFTAKVATEVNKPNGQKTVPPEEVEAFLEKLPINKFFGVGKVTVDKMLRMGIFTGKELKQQSLESLTYNFGKQGKFYFDIVRGIQYSGVKSERERKSIAAENTFNSDIISRFRVIEKLSGIADHVEKRLKSANMKAKTITLKVKYNDFHQQTRSKTMHAYLQNKNEFFPFLEELVELIDVEKPIRLLGISFTNFEKEATPIIEIPQLTLGF